MGETGPPCAHLCARFPLTGFVTCLDFEGQVRRECEQQVQGDHAVGEGARALLLANLATHEQQLGSLLIVVDDAGLVHHTGHW